MLPRRCRFSSYANVLALHKITRKLPNSPPFLSVSLSVKPLIILWNCHFFQITGKDPPPHLSIALNIVPSPFQYLLLKLTIQVFLWNRASRCNTEHKRSDDCARNSTENENVLRMSLLNKLYSHSLVLKTIFSIVRTGTKKRKLSKPYVGGRLIVKELP